MLSTDDYLKILETCPIKGHDDAIIRALRYIDLGYPVMLYGPPGEWKDDDCRASSDLSRRCKGFVL